MEKLFVMERCLSGAEVKLHHTERIILETCLSQSHRIRITWMSSSCPPAVTGLGVWTQSLLTLSISLRVVWDCSSREDGPPGEWLVQAGWTQSSLPICFKRGKKSAQYRDAWLPVCLIQIIRHQQDPRKMLSLTVLIRKCIFFERFCNKLSNLFTNQVCSG